MTSRRLATAIVLAAVCVPVGAHASTQDLFGYGARSAAMGATGVACTDDASSVFVNPAGLSRLRDRSFVIGFLGAVPRFWIAPGGGVPQTHSADLARGTTIGLGIPLPFGGILQDRLVAAVGFYTPTDVIVRGRILDPMTPRFPLLEDRTQTVAVQVGLGAALPFGFRLGAGVSALAQIVGSVLVSVDASGRAGSRVDDQLVTTYAAIVGLSWERGPWRLGFVFRDQLVARFAVSIAARDLGLDLPVFNIAGIAQYDPRQMAFEGAWSDRGWTVTLGALGRLWGDYPGALEPTTPQSPSPPPPNFHHTLSPRAGVEHRWSWARTSVSARAGYLFEPTPAPLATGTSNLLDNDRHVLTAGLAVDGRWRGSILRMDWFFQAHVLAPRFATKAQDVPDSNPGSPALGYGGQMYVLGLSGTVTF